MTATPTLNATVHDLLTRASNAHDGAILANEAMNEDAAKTLTAKAQRLWRDANKVDPKREAAAWAERAAFVAEMEKE